MKARRVTGIFGFGLVALTGTMLMAAPAAVAHVGVSSLDAEQDGHGLVTFQVPNESASARTVGLKVALPTDTPLASVRVESAPGWKATVKTSELPQAVDDGHGGSITQAPSTVLWEATGEGISEGEFARFTLSVGSFPDQSELLFPVTQKYSDGTSVAWNQQTVDGVEASRPAPVLKLSSSPARVSTAAAEDKEVERETEPVAQSEEAQQASSAVGWFGLAFGIVGLIASSAALILVRRGAPRSPQ